MTTNKKKKSVQVRLGETAYKIVRQEAYRRHVPMTDILEEMAANYKATQSNLSQ